MKAFLLAAGIGSRLRPLTDTTPKCLLTFGGRTLLDIWLAELDRAGVDDVLINVHHLADRVRAHVAGITGGPTIHLVEEATLLGSAGTIRANRDFVSSQDCFLAINADNLTDFDLTELVTAHRRGGRIATLSLFHAPRPTECGIVELDGDRVVGFVEKPAEPRSDLANAGMYAFSSAVVDEIRGAPPQDIGYHLIPHLVGRATGVSIGDAYLADIGTPEALARARHRWPVGELS